MNEHDELELLDLDDDAEIEMPEGFETCPRPRRPWLLFAAGAVVIALASYIVVRIAGKPSDNIVDIRLDMPISEPVTPAAAPLAEPEPELPGAPVRVVEDRVEAEFRPDVAVPRPRPLTPQNQAAPPPAARPAAPRPAPRPAPAARPAAPSGYMVQLGAYDTRESALAAQRRLQARHPALLGDRQFVVLAAQVHGRTIHRLRVVGFTTARDASGFCNNAKSDGLDCFVSR